MTFDELCRGCTPEERKALAEHLAMLRMRETLKLAEAPMHTCAPGPVGNMSPDRYPRCSICGRLVLTPNKNSPERER